MIYEGQAKRRMAKILERRPCVCAACEKRRAAANLPWPGATTDYILKDSKSTKKTEEAKNA